MTQLSNLIDKNAHDFFMVDVETDGFSPHQNSMTSVCVVKFHPFTGDVIDKFHMRFVKSLTGRFADKETLKWRKDNHMDTREAALEGRMPVDLMSELHNFFGGYKPEKKAVVFANHTEFDIGFLWGYFTSMGMDTPWAYNKVFELNSILLGRGIGNKSDLIIELLESERWKEVLSLHFNGKDSKHDAFYDCVFQIELLMRAFD